MQAFRLTDLNDFMIRLLTTDLFYEFIVSEASVTSFTTFHIDGSWHPDYFSSSVPEETVPDHLLWSALQPRMKDLIKGKNLPLKMTLILRLAPDYVEKVVRQAGLNIDAGQIAGFFLNIQYQRDRLICTTGTSLKIFLMDKSVEHAWDDLVGRLFRQRGIPYELL